MNKHTPGPWHVDNRFPVDILDDNGNDIATALREEQNGMNLMIRGVLVVRDESFANARLIAAAPEMYDMLCAFKEGSPPKYDDMINLLNRINHA